MPEPFVHHSTCVVIQGRGVLIVGPSGSGKSSLALALLDRGAELVGDDGVLLTIREGRLVASPHPNTRGLVEVRNLGILRFPCRDDVPVALLLTLDPAAPRFIDAAETALIEGIGVPWVRVWPDGPTLAIKAELAMLHYGLTG